jgi:hypothetical protein
VPVHYDLTERKLHILDRLTARLTYGVWVWSRLFNEDTLRATYADEAEFYEQVKAETCLPGHMVQCCYDAAKWMWRSYRELHREWDYHRVSVNAGVVWPPGLEPLVGTS